MMWLLTSAGSKLASLVAVVLAVLGSIWLVFRSGQKDQKAKEKVKDLESYKETREKIDEVPVNTDVAAAIKRLSGDGGLRD